ncbi:MAG: GNAT family N-acetyltransferase [Chloroflexota bacterium]
MEIADIRELYDEYMRRRATFAGTRRETVDPVVRYVNTFSPHSFVRYAALTEDNADAIIQREIACFAEMEHRMEWTLYDHDRPADMKARLEKAGFDPGEVEMILVLDLENLPERLQRETDHDIREVTDYTQVSPILNAVQNVAFDDEPDNWINNHMTKIMRDHADQYQFFCAYVDDAPVSAAWIEYLEGESPFAGLYGGATLAAHRGKGFYSALVAMRAKFAQQRGYRFLTVDASPMSAPILERIGFMAIARSWAAEYRGQST